MRFFGKTSINFLRVRYHMYALSGLVILAGIVSLVVKGIDFGVDFRGGTELTLHFDQKLEIADIRNALGTIGLANSEIKSFGLEGDLLIRTTEQAEGTVVADRIKGSIAQTFPQVKFEVLKQYKISPKISSELREDALYAVIASLVVILIYIGMRFKFVYGFGAVLALFHDVAVTFGILSLLDGVIPINLEINQEIIAAFLTIIGVSVNDTVVVFDRIRENEKIYRSMSLFEVVNRSVNDTLSRTVITNGTVFLVLLTLLIFGGEVTRGFAFTLTVGTIAGTYSTVYMASALVIDWTNRKKNPRVRGE